MEHQKMATAALFVFVGILSVQEILGQPPSPSNCIEVACRCPFGTTWITDENDCRRCSCDPPPEGPPNPICPVCPPFCRSEPQAGSPCPRCQCALPPPPPGDCPLLRCPFPPLECPNGYLQRNGCPTCECNPNPNPICPQLRCLDQVRPRCRYGLKRDGNNCELCECKSAPILPICPPEPRCRLFTRCANGIKKDANGCTSPICECNNQVSGGCPPEPRCAAFTLCLNGFAKDSNGCTNPRCLCASSIQPPFNCQFRLCPNSCGINGYKRDIEGCQTCECNTPPICPPVACPDRSVCPLGTVTTRGRDGCVTSCRCRTDRPEINLRCPSGVCGLFCRFPDRFSERIAACSCDCTGANPP